MHHRSTGPFAAALRAAAARCADHLTRRRARLLTLGAVLALAATVTLALPHRPGGTQPVTASAQVAAASRELPPGKIGGAAARPDTTAEIGSATQAAIGAGAGTGAAAAAGAGQAGAAAAAEGPTHQQGDDPGQDEQPGAADPNCTLLVPAAPTSASGLATPYRLTATDAAAGPCHEADADQSAFVEATVYDPATHALSVYHPLVVDARSRPAQPPVPVTLPAGAVVGVWFGYNGDTLTLAGPGARSCVNGLPGSPFGQFAYCNAAAFFAAANADAVLQAAIPAVGTGTDGRPCPTTRDFAVVDQDQSDNLATAYRVIGGRLAQLTPATATRGAALTNGSDEGLLAHAVDPALGCTPFTAPDLTNGGAPTAALALNELSAAKGQAAPAALVPTNDPMVRVDGQVSRRKTDLYRAGVDMPRLPAGQTAQEYCADLARIAPARLAADAALLRRAPAPADGQPDLLAFLRDRYTTTLQNLDCRQAGTAPPATVAPTTPATPTSAAAPTATAAASSTPATTAPVRPAPRPTAPHPRAPRPTAPHPTAPVATGVPGTPTPSSAAPTSAPSAAPTPAG